MVDAALDEALAEPGCPLCRLVDRGLERHFDSLLWELVNDPGVRQELRASLGLCPRHWWGLVHVEQTRTRNVLGLAILFQDVIAHVAEALDALSSQNGRRLSKRGRGQGARAMAGLAERLARCPACRHERWVQESYVARLVERLEQNPSADGGWRLCPEHLGAVMAMRKSTAWPPGWLRSASRSAAGQSPTADAALNVERAAGQLLPRPSVVGPVLHGGQLLGGDHGTPCSVCSELSLGSRSADSLAPRLAGRGMTLCSVHIREVPDAGRWVEAARRTLAGGELYTLRCGRCEEEAVIQAELLLRAEGPLCFPHLVERLRLESRPSSASVIRTTAAWARELAERLTGFIRKQDWNVKQPLTEAERTSVREAALFLGGARVIVPTSG